jgi:hypothetical protein
LQEDNLNWGRRIHPRIVPSSGDILTMQSVCSERITKFMNHECPSKNVTTDLLTLCLDRGNWRKGRRGYHVLCFDAKFEEERFVR